MAVASKGKRRIHVADTLWLWWVDTKGCHASCCAAMLYVIRDDRRVQVRFSLDRPCEGHAPFSVRYGSGDWCGLAIDASTHDRYLRDGVEPALVATSSLVRTLIDEAMSSSP